MTITKEKQVNEIIEILKKKGDKKRAEHDLIYFKEPVESFGVKVPDCRLLANQYYALNRNELSLEKTLILAEELLKKKNLNSDTFAIQLLSKHKTKLEQKHFAIFEKWVDKYVNNWATCDDLSCHYIGYLLEKHPILTKEIVSWAKSNNLWKRRSCCVSFIVPTKKGLYLDTIFKIAKELAYDKEDMVQKGCGWMLKDTSVKNKPKVLDFLKNYKDAPRVFLRYALERMQQKEKDIILNKSIFDYAKN